MIKYLNPLISVITPTYNSEKYISKCLDSLFNQEFNSFEHIVVDSLSVDRTLEIVKKYNKSKIIIKKSNIYEAYNIAIKESKGKFIYILNSDDEIHKDSFNKFYNAYLKNNNTDLFTSIGIEFKDSKINYHRKRIFTDAKLFEKGIIKFKSQSILGCFISKETYQKLNYFNIKYSISSDKDFLIKMALSRLRVNNIMHNSYFIRSHSDSTTFGNSSKNKLKQAIFQNFEIVEQYLNNKNTLLGVKYFCNQIYVYRKIQFIKINKNFSFLNKLKEILYLFPHFILLLIYFIRIKVYEKLINY